MRVIEILRRDDLADEAAGQRLVGGQVLGEQQHAFCSRRPERRHQPRVVLDRQAVAERARDRHAEARRRRRDPQVATGRDRQPAADREAFDRGKRRERQRLDRGEVALHLAFVGDAVLAGAERLELRDVGAGDERLAAGAAEHRDAQVRLGTHACADFAELLVHVPGHGVARRRAVEDHGGDLAVAAVADFAVRHVFLLPSRRCFVPLPLAGRGQGWGLTMPSKDPLPNPPPPGGRERESPVPLNFAAA